MNDGGIGNSGCFAGLMRLVNGYQVSQALHVAAVLGIADLLAAGARSSEALAEATATHPQALYRVLRALAAADVLHEGEGQRFSLAPMGALLRSDATEPAGPWAALIGRAYLWQAWSGLLHSIRTGEPAFPMVHGADVWAYRASHSGESGIFDAAMTALSQDVVTAVVGAYDFTPFARAVDVGGGRGALMGGILAAVPGLCGVVFDQPHVVDQARPELKRLGVSDRCEVIGGDFFEAVPGGDLVLLKAILHDWDDARAVAILRMCRKAIAPDGTLLVLERVLAGPNEGADAKFADLNMLVVTGGYERSAAEFAVLFKSAGFELTRIVQTSTRMAICEGVGA